MGQRRRDLDALRSEVEAGDLDTVPPRQVPSGATRPAADIEHAQSGTQVELVDQLHSGPSAVKLIDWRKLVGIQVVAVRAHRREHIENLASQLAL